MTLGIHEEILLLRKRGHSTREIARLTGVGKSQVGEWINRDLRAEEDYDGYDEFGSDDPPDDELKTDILKNISYRRGGATVAQLSAILEVSGVKVANALRELHDSGLNINRVGEFYVHERQIQPGAVGEFSYLSRPDNTYRFGFIGDTHLGSKYERLDVLEWLYEIFRKAKVDRVFHAGNWIEGESRFNRFDIKVYGLDAQLDYFVRNYPQIGVATYAVTGDDHEGWYAKREGIDVGRRLAQDMITAGRKDWVNLGYMEAFVPLVNANTGRTSNLLVMHPGGGSAYAISYKPQKIVESFAGGEKPSVLLIGHYHKMSMNIVRNVWAIQVGCTQDQTPFMRKKQLQAHVGGGICTLEQDPATGAITGCSVRMLQYFNKGYYNNRWNPAGPVNLPERSIHP